MSQELRLKNPRWTKRDYEMVAEVLKNRYSEKNSEVIDMLAFHFAEKFGKDNAAFNEKRFLTACGVTE